MPWARDKKRIYQNRQKFLDYKKTLECKECGISDHRLLEFHHIGDKDRDVSDMVSYGYGWSRVEQEIKKCIPLCCNCHRLIHYEESP